MQIRKKNDLVIKIFSIMKLFHVFRFTKKSFLAAKKHNKENEEEIRSECTGGDAVGGRVTDITVKWCICFWARC